MRASGTNTPERARCAICGAESCQEPTHRGTPQQWQEWQRRREDLGISALAQLHDRRGRRLARLNAEFERLTVEMVAKEILALVPNAVYARFETVEYTEGMRLTDDPQLRLADGQSGLLSEFAHGLVLDDLDGGSLVSSLSDRGIEPDPELEIDLLTVAKL